MASETLIRTALQLAKQLGANTSKFMGTKSNVSFLGSGPKDGMLFQQSINPESLLHLVLKKFYPILGHQILGQVFGSKIIQANKLIDNMSVMLDVIDPLAAKNVVDASSKFGGGLESLKGLGLKNLDNVRAKSGLGERQVTEAAADTSPLMSKLENRVGGMRGDIENRVGTLLDDVGMTPQAIDASIASDKSGIMASVDKGDLPAKTGAAREFLVNSLKVGDDYPSTTLSDVMSAEDMKYIFEGGGGAMGDPLVLVQKYFGPRIAEMVPTGGSSEEIAIFTKRVMENVEDAKGLKPDEQGFDTMTARFIDEFTPPEGGQPFAKGGLAKILEL